MNQLNWQLNRLNLGIELIKLTFTLKMSKGKPIFGVPYHMQNNLLINQLAITKNQTKNAFLLHRKKKSRTFAAQWGKGAFFSTFGGLRGT